MAEEQAVVSVADLLLKHGLVTREVLNEANRRRREEDRPLGYVLFEMKAVNEQKKLELFRQHFGLEVVSLEDFQIDPFDLGRLPKSFCERNCMAGILVDHGTLVVAIEDPTNVVVLDEAASLSNMSIHPVIASVPDILTALSHYPDKTAEEEEAAVQSSRNRKAGLFHSLIFVFLLILPIPLLISGIMYIKDLQTFYKDLEQYEKYLVFFLAWALWAATVYELDGLIWSRRRELR